MLLEKQLHFFRELVLVDVQFEFLHLPNVNINRNRKQLEDRTLGLAILGADRIVSHVTELAHDGYKNFFDQVCQLGQDGHELVLVGNQHLPEHPERTGKQIDDLQIIFLK